VCWGFDNFGQLGDGVPDLTQPSSIYDPPQFEVPPPMPVPRVRNVAQIAAGGFDTCAVMEDTTVRCWGINDSGQLGFGPIVQGGIRTPPSAPGVSGAVQISTSIRPFGNHTCALLASEKVKCWGGNETGQLGDGTSQTPQSPPLPRRPLFSARTRPARLLDTRRADVLVTSARVDVGSLTDGAALNVTVVDQKTAGFVTVWPCDRPMPTTSNLNYTPGAAIPNAVHVTPSPTGEVCFASSSAVHLIVDLAGLWSNAEGFAGQTPERLLDTRKAGAKVTNATVTGFDVAKATFVNLTVVDPEEAGFLTVWPCAQSRPVSSNLNFVAGETRAAAALVKPDSTGKVCVYSSSKAHLLVDRMGTLPGSRVDTSHAGRLIDSRDQKDRLNAGPTTLVGSAKAVRVVNVTAVDSTSAGFVTVYDDLSGKPDSSNVNYASNRASSNSVVIPDDGNIVGLAPTDWHAIVDLQAEIT
jgi:Regulator of chromosome condensation (RCC1) repeat